MVDTNIKYDNDPDLERLDKKMNVGGVHSDPYFIDHLQENELKVLDKKRFADRKLSKSDIFCPAFDGTHWFMMYDDKNNAKHKYDRVFSKAYERSVSYFRQDPKFEVTDDKLIYSPNNKVFAFNINTAWSFKEKLISLMFRAGIPKSAIQNAKTEDKYFITDDFLIFLEMQNNWKHFAKGAFDKAVANIMNQSDLQKSGLIGGDLY